MWGWISAGLAVAALVAWIFYRGAMLSRIYADAHFTEVAQGVARIKVAATERVIESDDDDDVRSRTDPRALVTSAGLALVYTVRRVEDRFVHHCSVSNGWFTVPAVGQSYVLFMAKLLGVPFESLALGIGLSTARHAKFHGVGWGTVHHAEFQLLRTEQAEFAARPVPEVSLAEITAFRGEWLEASKRLHWHREESSAPD